MTHCPLVVSELIPTDHSHRSVDGKLLLSHDRWGAYHTPHQLTEGGTGESRPHRQSVASTQNHLAARATALTRSYYHIKMFRICTTSCSESSPPTKSISNIRPSI